MRRKPSHKLWNRRAAMIRRGRPQSENNPFEVGGTYRNRLGEYEVVAMEAPLITVQYQDGTMLEGTVDVLGRIWRNIRAEEQSEKDERERAERISLERNLFRGFAKRDFGNGIRGTHWRRRDSLGGLLAERLSSSIPLDLKSYPIRARPEVHLATKEYDNSKEARAHAAKLMLALDEDRVRYGFNIKRRSGPLTGSWDWFVFIAAIQEDRSLQAGIEAAMREHDLHWQIQEWHGDGGDDVLAGWVELANEEGLIWRSAQGGEGEPVGWADFAERIRTIGRTSGCNLYLCNELDRDDAIAAGRPVFRPVVRAYRSLVPLYRTCALDGVEDIASA
jgi:hypothetical protein